MRPSERARVTGVDGLSKFPKECQMRIWTLAAFVLLGSLSACNEPAPQAPPPKSGIEVKAPGVDIKIDKEGANIKAPGAEVKIDKEGADIKAPGADVKVDERGVDVQVPGKDDNRE
jgi:hypothetical protein